MPPILPQTWLDEYKKAYNSALDKGPDQRILLVGNLNDHAGLTGLIRCMRLEPGGQRLRCVYQVGAGRCWTQTTNRQLPTTDVTPSSPNCQPPTSHCH